MRSFLRHFKALHLWLLGCAAALGLFYALRGQKPLMTALAEGFSMPLEQWLGRALAPVPFSVAELCYAAAVVFAVEFPVRTAVLLLRREYRLETLYRRLLLLADLLLTVWALFCLLWGVNFYAEDFCDKSGIYPEPVAYDDLAAVTRLFAEKAAEYAPQVPRTEGGLYSVPRQETLDAAPALYQRLYGEFPFLALPEDPRPKPIFFSKVMSAMNVTGLYFPFTGESNLNMDFPAATFPFTVAHELAHRRGIASEQQCNFLGVLAATRSEDPAWAYSGWLTGLIHLTNALYRVDRDAVVKLSAALPEEVLADLDVNNAYWQRWEGPVSDVSGKAYDKMLRGYGDELGMKSYGAVVDLLVAYYK